MLENMNKASKLIQLNAEDFSKKLKEQYRRLEIH